VNVSKTVTTALWFSSFDLFIRFRQFLAADDRKKERDMAKIRTEVLIETRETFIIKRKPAFLRLWCEDCARDVNTVSLPEASLLTGYDVKAIRSMMENQDLHFRYLRAETLYICLRSLYLL
jgi:hypothetical protein